MKQIKNIIIFLICLISGCEAVMAQAPTSPVQLTTSSAYFEPSTHLRWFYNGATYKWWQAVDSVTLFTKTHNWYGSQTYHNGLTTFSNIGTLYNQGSYIFFENTAGTGKMQIYAQDVTGNQIDTIQSKPGTFALKSDIPRGLPPTGAAGGDLTGNYPNPTVNTINGVSKNYYDPTSSIQTQLNARELLSNKTSTPSSSTTLYPNWLGVTNSLATKANKVNVRVYFLVGESNAAGYVPIPGNVSPTDTAVRTNSFILNNSNLQIQNLHIGVNNELGTNTSNTFGWDLSIANSVPMADSVYIVNIAYAGAGIGQLITQLPTAFARIDTALKQIRALGKVPAPYILYSQGINDMNNSIDTTTWKTQTASYIQQIRQHIGFAPIVITKFNQTGYSTYNTTIANLPASIDWIFPINPTPATTQSASPAHWDKAGMATIYTYFQNSWNLNINSKENNIKSEIDRGTQQNYPVYKTANIGSLTMGAVTLGSHFGIFNWHTDNVAQDNLCFYCATPIVNNQSTGIGINGTANLNIFAYAGLANIRFGGYDASAMNDGNSYAYFKSDGTFHINNYATSVQNIFNWGSSNTAQNNLQLYYSGSSTLFAGIALNGSAKLNIASITSTGGIRFLIGHDATDASDANSLAYFSPNGQLTINNYQTNFTNILNWGNSNTAQNNLTLYSGGTSTTNSGVGINGTANVNIFSGLGGIRFGNNDASSATTTNSWAYFANNGQFTINNYQTNLSNILNWSSSNTTQDHISLYNNGSIYAGIGLNGSAVVNMFSPTIGGIRLGVGHHTADQTNANSAFYITGSNLVFINGGIGINGSSSGTVTETSVTGTYNFIHASSAGTSGQIYTSGGGGTTPNAWISTVPIANGGTGSSTQNFVDLTTAQSSIAGAKGFTTSVTTPILNITNGTVGSSSQVYAGSSSFWASYPTGTTPGSSNYLDVWDSGATHYINSTGTTALARNGTLYVQANSNGVQLNVSGASVGSIYYQSASGALANLGIGAQNSILTVNSSNLPSYTSSPTLTGLTVAQTPTFSQAFSGNVGVDSILVHKTTGRIAVISPNAYLLTTSGVNQTLTGSGGLVIGNAGLFIGPSNNLSFQNAAGTANLSLVATGSGNQTLTVPWATGTLMLNPMTTSGDIIYGGSSGTPTRLTLGSSAAILGVNIGGTGLEYKTFSPSNGVSISNTAGVIGISLTYPPSGSDLTAQTSSTSIGYTLGASDGTFNVGANTTVTTAGGGTLTTTVVYTDETNTSRTLTFYNQGATAAGITSGVSSYPEFGSIRVKASSTISVNFTLTGGTMTYNARATFQQLR